VDAGAGDVGLALAVVAGAEAGAGGGALSEVPTGVAVLVTVGAEGGGLFSAWHAMSRTTKAARKAIRMGVSICEKRTQRNRQGFGSPRGVSPNLAASAVDAVETPLPRPLAV
jgi:hypothetical protein